MICVNVGTRRERKMGVPNNGSHRMTRIPANPTKATPAAASSEELLSLANPFLEVQRAQWAAWQSWQQSLATFHKDFWEQWAVRFAGGLPFDG